jgi:hypothetical protein
MTRRSRTPGRPVPSPLRLSAGKARPHRVDDLPTGRKYTQRGQRATINYDRPIDKHLEFAVVAANHLDVGTQLATEPRRHPDGVYP